MHSTYQHKNAHRPITEITNYDDKGVQKRKKTIYNQNPHQRKTNITNNTKPSSQKKSYTMLDMT